AALDAALATGLPCGGWCPRGRRAEDGPIHERYPLLETPSGRYAQRTEWNVRDSDGTLILTRGEPAGGTALTRRLASRLGTPFLMLEPATPGAPAAAVEWIGREGIRTLNVAGPRESEAPGIHGQALEFLGRVLALSRDG
ncbi:MAG: putative molybdenum carrier protein, partial [bacterium]